MPLPKIAAVLVPVDLRALSPAVLRMRLHWCERSSERLREELQRRVCADWSINSEMGQRSEEGSR